MGLSGNNSPNRVAFTEPRPSYEVLAGTVVEEVAPAVELTRRLVLAWLSGLRDMQNTQLMPFFAETPRARVSANDIDARYSAIVEVADELGVSPVSQAEFVKLFLAGAAQTTFIEMMQRLGYELEYSEDLIDLSDEILAYENPNMPVLTGVQETDDRVINPTTMADLLESIERPSLVTTTKHFVNDYPENDALDADQKAHERIFVTFADYIRRMLLLKT